jgi:hypothetical protein
MVEAMRDVKKRYFYEPPLTDADFVSLGLKPKDTTPTAIEEPKGQADADIAYPGKTQLELRIKHVDGTPLDPRSDYGCRVYHGVYAPDETPPESGEDLRESLFSKRRKLMYSFGPKSSGKTAYFCIRYENSKGQKGPWGPIFSAIIP